MKIPSEFKISRLRECPYQATADSPDRCVEYWNTHITAADWFSADKEHCVVLILNARLGLVGHHLISIGTVSECCVHPREVLRPAIMHSAYSFIVMHNHPSGDPSPSSADHRVTSNLRDASKIMQIAFNDHVIVGGRHGSPAYYSFKESGFL